jgi:diguanylate cyclase (GGDEF)-like protein/PAS domain S-box-containing protein
MDADGVIRYANPKFEATSGYSAGEAVGQSASILESGAHPSAVYTEMWETLRTGKPFRFVFTNRRKDGSSYDEGVIVSPIDDPESGQTYYLHLGRLIKFTRQTYDVFTILANSAPAGIYLQRDGVLYFVNDRLAAMLGRPAGELIGAEWTRFVAEDDRERVVSYVAETSQDESGPPVECRIHTPDGLRWVMATSQPVVLNGPAAVSGNFEAGYVVDITANKLVEDRLRNAISVHQATIESTTDGIVVINQDRKIVSNNQRFEEMWKLQDAISTDPDDVRRSISAQLLDPAGFKQLLEQTREDPMLEEMAAVDLIDGRHMEVYSKPQIVDGEVVGRVWSWRDVTERRRFESALMRLASYDSLTGLMNRRKIQEEMESCLAAGSVAQGALLLLDLDGFKEVNDTFGHQTGDEVLLQVARVLADCDVGELIGRFGGDEFAILLPGVTPAQAIQAAERMLNRLSNHEFVASEARISLTGSMGVALYPKHAETSDELLSAADLALYEAKSHEDSNLHIYSPRLKQRSRLQRRSDWQMQLRNAISNSKGKLYAEKALALRASLPPIYRMTMRMIGARGQVVSTHDLGVMAQQANLSLALDRWVLSEILALARRPSFVANPAGLAFELSVHSLAHPDVLRRLLDLGALRAAHTSPLIVELTDLKSAANAQGAIASLRAAGYRFKVQEQNSRKLANVLGVLPIDYLKLDGSVVGELEENPAIRPLIEGVVQMARSLNACTVVDDVSTSSTLEALRSLGVDYARGPAVAPARSAGSVFKTGGGRLRAA